MARLLIIAGIIMVFVGAILHFAPGLFGWIGKLPGDIRIESDKTRIFIPVTTMIIISLILTLIINLFRR